MNDSPRTPLNDMARALAKGLVLAATLYYSLAALAEIYGRLGRHAAVDFILAACGWGWLASERAARRGRPRPQAFFLAAGWACAVALTVYVLGAWLRR